MRVLILGAGVVGCMAAWRMATAGHEVTVFEQFGLDHDQGSSYGDSRVVRRVYDDPFYTKLAGQAYALWDDLQAQFPHEEIFFRAGGLFFGLPNHPRMRAAQEALAGAGVEHEVLDFAEAIQRYPALKLKRSEIALHEPSMGYARASHAVRAAADLARQNGAQIREETQIVGIQQDSAGTGVRLFTKEGDEFVGERLLICAGPWTGPLLQSLGVRLPLFVTRQPYIHLAPAKDAEDFEVGKFPVWIDAESWHYGFPHLGDVPGVKIAWHEGGQPTTPEAVERAVRDKDRQELIRYAAGRFPSLSDRVVYEKVCLYTMAPDEDFIIDAVPGLTGAYFISGCSGHGFKFGPLLGQIGADLVTGTSVPKQLSRFRLSRFA